MENPKDPLASYTIASLTFSLIFLVAFLVKGSIAIGALIFSGASLPALNIQDLAEALGFLLLLSVLSGPPVAFVRGSLMRGSRIRQKNFVTGAMVGIVYASSCYYFFGREMGMAGIGLATFVFIAIWYAVTSGFNEAFNLK